MTKNRPGMTRKENALLNNFTGQDEDKILFFLATRLGVMQYIQTEDKLQRFPDLGIK